ncbi:MAG: hypothetical protein AAFO63_06870 [Pseudomonadota bacterium]
MKSVFSLILLTGALAVLATPAHADDELVLLPGQGELRDRADRERFKAERLKPGAGLFISFDSDSDGAVTPMEIDAGIPLAFDSADANADGYLTALEQQDWAASLPTRDDSLANPVRFDPNLDRRVNLTEFTSVISGLGEDYADEETGNVLVSSLKAPKPERPERGEQLETLRDRVRQGGPAQRERANNS